MIDQATIDRIFDAAEIVDVVGDFVSLKKRGTNYLGLCPFHNEKTPSFMVSPAKGIYKCFGCGVGGNPVNFVMEHEQLSYPDALRYLAKKYNIEIAEKEESAEQIQQKNERESLMIVTDYAKKYFVDQLQETEEGLAVGLSYFKERGFTNETLKTFELGYSPEKRDAFTTKAIASGYKLEYLTQAGLSVDKENYRADRFWGRVVFPIHNMAGRVIAFGARTLRTDKKIAKYLNSPESPIYHKSNVLYGIYQAKRSIIQQDKCYLVEGYTDVLSMHQAGIHNVVASSGTSLTENQIRLVKRFTNNLTILYDGDPAGIKASLRGIDLVLQLDINVKVMLLPEGEDPDSFAKSHSADELTDFIVQNETDFIRFKAGLLLKDAKDSVTRAQAIKDIVSSVSKIDDEIKRQVYIKETYQLLGIKEEHLARQVKNIKDVERQQKTKREKTRKQVEEPPIFVPDDQQGGAEELSRMDRVERQIVYLMLKHANEQMPVEEEEDQIKVGEFIIFELEEDNIEFSDPTCKKIMEIYQAKADTGQLPEQGFFIRSQDTDIQQLCTELISKEPQLSEFWKKQSPFIKSDELNLKKGVLRQVLEYKALWVEKEWEKLQTQLKAVAPEAVMELMAQMQQLQNIKNLLSDKLGRIMG